MGSIVAKANLPCMYFFHLSFVGELHNSYPHFHFSLQIPEPEYVTKFLLRRNPAKNVTLSENFGTIPAKQSFTISMRVSKLDTGNFVNPQTNYFGAPSQLNGQGILIAHSHVVIEKINSFDDTTVPDPTTFCKLPNIML